MPTDNHFDDLLKRALIQAAMEDLAPVLEEADGLEIDFSPAYTARRRALLEDPTGCARRDRRARKPAWRRILKTVACLAIAALLTLSALYAVNPDVRAWVRQLFIEWLPDRASIIFQGAPQDHGETGDWRPTYLPEGFELAEEGGLAMMSLKYENAESVRIYLDYVTDSYFNFVIDTEHQDHYQIEINGKTADFFPASVTGENSYLIWTDEDTNTCFELMSCIEDTSELIKIAESMRFYGTHKT